MSRERPLVKLYRCRDGCFIHLQAQFAYLAARTCAVLGCDVASGTDVVAERVARWDARRPSRTPAGGRGRAARHGPHRGGVVGPSAGGGHRAVGPGQRREDRGERDRGAAWRGRPLDGVRVLDLSRLLAGPTNARTLAEHGAEVLLVNGVPAGVSPSSWTPVTASAPVAWSSTTRRTRQPCASWPAGPMCSPRAIVVALLARRGFGPEELAATRPGIVVVTINCYGDGGPWHLRPGWEQMAQTVSGMVIGQGTIDHPAGPRRGPRLHDRVPRRPGHDGSPLAPGPRGGQLSRACLVVSDRPLVHRGTGRARRCPPASATSPRTW